MTRHKNQTSRARRHTRHLKLQGGVNPQITQLTINNVINTNEEFNTRKHDFVTIYETDPDMLYNIKELSPSAWKFGYLVTNRFTPRTRDELNQALLIMFYDLKDENTFRPNINGDVLYEFGPVATWDTRFITDMSDLSEYMYYDMNDTWPYDISNWNMQNVETMTMMFAKCKYLKRVDVSKWYIPKVKYMKNMFLQCDLFKRLDFTNETHSLNFEPFNVNNVIDMEGMFKECFNLRHLDFSNWKPRNLKKACAMFSLCSGLQSLTFNLYENNDVLVAEMFYGVPNTASININLTPWQWYLSNLSFAEILPIPILSIKIPSPLMSQYQLELLSTIQFSPNWFGAHTRRVFEWQDLDDVDVWGMVYFGHYKNDLYKQRRLRAVLMYLYNEETPDLPCLERCNTTGRKQWSNIVSHELSTIQIGSPLENKDVKNQHLKNAELREEEAFVAFINAENRALKSYSDNSPSQTVLVGAAVHGEYNCDITNLELPMFTIPEGKSLIIISVPTPGVGNFTDDSYIEKELFLHFHTLLQDPQFRIQMDHNPNYFSKIIETICQISKYEIYIHLIKTRSRENGAEPVKLYTPDQKDFCENFEDTRVLYFKSGDNCANKTFTTQYEKKPRLMKLISICENSCNTNEKNLLPPRIMDDIKNEITLSKLCYQLFTLSEHSTIILIDFTCSTFVSKKVELPQKERNIMANRALQLRFGGGSHQ